MNAKVNVSNDGKISCTLLKDENGNNIENTVPNVFSVKWSKSSADQYPVGAIEYYSNPGEVAHVQIPASDVYVNLGTGWELKTDISKNIYALSFHGTIVTGVQYMELNSAKQAENDKIITRTAITFVLSINESPRGANVKFVGDEPVVDIGGRTLGFMSSAVIDYNNRRVPRCEATLTVTSEFIG